MRRILPENSKIGFIGLGVMGKAMARNVLKAGYALTVHNRSRGSVDELAAEGAVAASSPAEVAGASNVVMLCVPDTPDVEAVLFGANGVAAQARMGLIVIDTSTISATATRDFARRLEAKAAHLIDCPVSGGPKGAVDGVVWRLGAKTRTPVVMSEQMQAPAAKFRASPRYR